MVTIMKKTINKAKYLLVLAVMLLAGNYIFGGTPITIGMNRIRFDSGNLLTLGDGTSNNQTLSEYFYFQLNDINDITNDVILTLSSNCQNPVILMITAHTDSTDGFGNICYVNYDCTISSSGTAFYLKPDGAVPNTISKHDFNWHWTITVIPKCNTSLYDACTHTFDTYHCCYMLWDAPIEPMDEPWVGVLDKAVGFAGGAYEYENEVIEALTTNLYSSKAFYNSSEHFTIPNYTNFNLSLLLVHWDSLNTVMMDCRDFANFLHVLANALGIDCGYYNVDLDEDHYLNCLKPSGWPGDGISCYTKWDYHQFAWYNSMVADASTMIDTDSNPTGSSSYHIWALAKGNMSLSYYLDKLTEYGTGSVQTGKCIPY
jgi:hypothetical protein